MAKLKEIKENLIKAVQKSKLDEDDKDYYEGEINEAKKAEIDEIKEDLKNEEKFDESLLEDSEDVPKKEEKPEKKQSKKEPKNEEKFDIIINSSKDTKEHYLEINPEGDKCTVFIDVPNKVGKSVRLKKLKECEVKVSRKNAETYIMPPLVKSRLVDFVKQGNSWSIIERSTSK